MGGVEREALAEDGDLGLQQVSESGIVREAAAPSCG